MIIIISRQLGITGTPPKNLIPLLFMESAAKQALISTPFTITKFYHIQKHSLEIYITTQVRKAAVGNLKGWVKWGSNLNTKIY